MNSIPYGRQDINRADIDSVVAILKSDFLTQGNVVPKFENSVSDYVKAKYAVAVNSATSALHIACLALGVRKGDRVWTSAITFVASANCALYCGAEVDFVDIDDKTYNLSIEKLEEKLIVAEKSGSLPYLLIAVHLCGQSCDMQSIKSLSDKYGFKVIEDASHAIGGKYKGEAIGNCHYSDITIFSFHPVKIITTGEGGMALTNNFELANQMRSLRSHGITNIQGEMELRPETEIWNYQQLSLGFNYRLTDIHAALGLSQMNRVSEFVQQRHEIADRYNQEFSNLPVLVPYQDPLTYSSYHLYVIRLDLNRIRKSQIEIYKEFQSEGILVNLHYIPVYLQPFYERKGFLRGYCPSAERYFHEAITLPLFSSLSEEELTRVISVTKKVISD